MGQLTLGLRSLAVKGAVFVVMAALLAWALGGTLFPGPNRVNFPAVRFAGAAWHWQVTGDGASAGPVSWAMIRESGGHSKTMDLGVSGVWREVWGPTVTPESMRVGVFAEGAKAGDGVVKAGEGGPARPGDRGTAAARPGDRSTAAAAACWLIEIDSKGSATARRAEFAELDELFKSRRGP